MGAGTTDGHPSSSWRSLPIADAPGVSKSPKPRDIPVLLLLAAGCWLLATGYWLLAHGSWDPRVRVLIPCHGPWILGHGSLLLRFAFLGPISRALVFRSAERAICPSSVTRVQKGALLAATGATTDQGRVTT